MTVQHTADCDTMQLGRAVQSLDWNYRTCTSPDELQEIVELWRVKGVNPCGCAKLALQRTETDLQRARKALCSAPGDRPDLEDKISCLVEVRDELRAEIAR